MADPSPALSLDPAAAVDVAVPLDSAYAATLRVLVTSLAADAGFSIDEIDDVKLAVSEVFNLLLDANSDGSGRAAVQLTCGADALTVTMRSGQAGTPIELDPLAKTILDSVVDDYSVSDAGITLVKRSVEASS